MCRLLVPRARSSSFVAPCVAAITCLFGCGEATRRPVDDELPVVEPASTTPEEAAPEEATPEEATVVETEPSLPLRLVPRPEPFFVVSSCLDARGETRADALRECRRLARSGSRFQRRWCTCAPDQALELRPDDPVAFYRGCCWAVGDTPEAARAECETRRREGWCEEDAEPVHVVTGPHPRRPPFRPYDGRELGYLAPSDLDDWFGESGEPPCFPAGTLVATADGERAIEAIRVGDQVLTRRGSELGLTPVRAVKTRRASLVVVVELEGRTLRITPEHPVWLDDAWRRAEAIEVGDLLTTPEGTARVAEVRVERLAREVFTLRVGPPHSFFAGGVWVHNY